MNIVANFFRTISLSAGCCYALACPIVGAPVYNHFLFFPDRGTGGYNIEAVRGVRREEVSIRSANGKKLHGWFFKLSDKSKVALVSHGNAGNLACRLELADSLLACGLSVLLYDYQGYGKSEGSPEVKSICEDGIAALEFLEFEKGYSLSDIVLYGESLGCAVTCHIAAAKPCSAMILQSGFSSLPDIAREKFPLLKFYPDWLFPKPALDNLSVVRKAHPPLLLIHGENDSLIPVSHARTMYDQACAFKQLVVLSGAGHNDLVGGHRQPYLSAISCFLGCLKSSVRKTVKP